MNTQDALLAMAAQLRTIENVRGEDVHVYPPPAENTKPPQIRLSRSRGSNSPATIYPTFILSEHFDSSSTWEMKNAGTFLHRWTAAIQLFIAPQTVPRYEQERLCYGWPRLVADALAASRSLSGAAYFIGGGAFPATLMVVEHDYLSWYSEKDNEPAPFWGIRFLVPVVQIHEGVTIGL